MVYRTIAPYYRSAIEYVERFWRAAVEDMTNDTSTMIGGTENSLFKREEKSTCRDGSGHHRQRETIQADAACLHHDEFAVLGQDRNRHE